MSKKQIKAKKKPKPKADRIEAALEVLQDDRQRKAATVLAYNGYCFGSGKKSGALTYAARQAGVVRNTIYDWLKDPNFVEAIEEVKAELVTVYLTGIRNAAKKNNVAACIYGLKQIEPELYDDQLRKDLVLLERRSQLGIPPERSDQTRTIVYNELPPGQRPPEEMH